MRNTEIGFESRPTPSGHSPGRRLRPSSPAAKSPSNRFSCAYNALKCSSRAAEEDDHRAMAPLPPRTGAKCKEPSRQSPSKSVGSYDSDASSQLLELTGMDTIDHAPFEDPRDGDDEDNEIVLTPRRTPSDDTHETPNVSNRDPVKFTAHKGLIVQALPDPIYDEFCQSNFNTPRMLHSKGSLGDEISPFDDESDEQDEESEVCDTYFRSALQSDPKIHLLLPSMNEPPTPTSRNSLMSEASSISLLYGESIAEEKKEPDEVDRGMTTIKQYNTVSLVATQTQEMSLPQQPRAVTGSTASESYQRLQHEDSSYSTVSSFVETPATKDRPPFFWRSHPKVTVYSSNSHLLPSKETREHSWQPSEASYHHDRRSSPHRGGSKMNLPSVKDRLLSINNDNSSFGFDLTMTSFTSFATSRLAFFGLRTSSS